MKLATPVVFVGAVVSVEVLGAVSGSVPAPPHPAIKTIRSNTKNHILPFPFMLYLLAILLWYIIYAAMGSKKLNRSKLSVKTTKVGFYVNSSDSLLYLLDILTKVNLTGI